MLACDSSIAPHDLHRTKAILDSCACPGGAMAPKDSFLCNSCAIRLQLETCSRQVETVSTRRFIKLPHLFPLI
jgi:hypothetical protein